MVSFRQLFYTLWKFREGKWYNVRKLRLPKWMKDAIRNIAGSDSFQVSKIQVRVLHLNSVPLVVTNYPSWVRLAYHRNTLKELSLGLETLTRLHKILTSGEFAFFRNKQVHNVFLAVNVNTPYENPNFEPCRIPLPEEIAKLVVIHNDLECEVFMFVRGDRVVPK